MLVTGVHQLRVLSTVPVGTEREIGGGPGLGPTLSSGGALWEAETQGQVCSSVTKASPVATVTPVIKINRELPRGSTAPSSDASSWKPHTTGRQVLQVQ